MFPRFGMNLCHRIRFCLFAIVAILSARTALAEVAVQYHCVGGSQLAAGTHLATLHKVLALPATANLENIALARFSNMLTNRLQLTNNPSSASLIKPLLSDVVERESLGSFGDAGASGPGFILAVHLEAQRTQLWQDNFAKVLGRAGEKFTSQEISGRRWNTTRANSLWIIPAQDWLLVGCGDDFSSLQTQYLSQIKAQGRPMPALQRNWLEADIASTRLGGWFRLLQPAHISLTVTTNEDDLAISARVLEAEAIPWKAAPWQIPKNLMRGQIISFTAGQDVAALLNVDQSFAHLASDPLTNQFFFWALDQMPFLDYLAWPVANASNALQRLATEAPAALNPELNRFNGTELVWHAEAGKLAWQNMRLFVPALEAVQTNDGQFLFASAFPKPSNGNNAPDALLAQIEGRTNLVYYDWELTGRRLGEWLILKRIIFKYLIGQDTDGKDTMFVGDQWLGGLTSLAGNTTTEITRVAPNELCLERKAPLGLTSVELVLLANSFCGVNSDTAHSSPPVGNTLPVPARP
jgi:hypothetical protein